MVDCAAASERGGGLVVKTLGDGLLCTFEETESALTAALDMQRLVEGRQLSVRIGFHLGPTIKSGDDIFGEAVNVAARVSSLANADEILFTGAVADRLPPTVRQQGTRFLEEIILKGKSEPTRIYELMPIEADTTGINARARAAQQVPQRLFLHHRRRFLGLRGGGMLSIGRDKGCDFLVDGDFVSRRHASIEAKNDRFYLTDHSTNGTYLALSDSTQFFLKRESLQVVGRGVLSLGQPPDKNEQNLIEFVVK